MVVVCNKIQTEFLVTPCLIHLSLCWKVAKFAKMYTSSSVVIKLSRALERSKVKRSRLEYSRTEQRRSKQNGGSIKQRVTKSIKRSCAWLLQYADVWSLPVCPFVWVSSNTCQHVLLYNTRVQELWNRSWEASPKGIQNTDTEKWFVWKSDY